MALRPLPNKDQRVLDSGRQIELGGLQFHPPASILDRSRISLISESRCCPDSRMSARYSACLSLISPNILSDEDFREANDGVERRAQLVRHVGEELALVLARRFELPALVLDLAEQPRVLDGQSRLRRERLQQVDHLRRESPAAVPVHGQRAEQVVLAQERHCQNRTIAAANEDLPYPALVTALRPRCRESRPARRSSPAVPARPRLSGWAWPGAPRPAHRAAGPPRAGKTPRAFRRTPRSIRRPCRQAELRARRSWGARSPDRASS